MAKKEHIPLSKNSKAIISRRAGYRENTKSGNNTGEWEAHHILCDHSLAGSLNMVKDNSEADWDFILACLEITEWNVNDEANMIGLWKNKHYRRTNPTFGENLPSHQVDHNTVAGYTNECKQWLYKNVWSTLKSKKEPHEVGAQEIKSALESAAQMFRFRLKERGRRGGGPAVCWDKRFSTEIPAARKQLWYMPFSMAKTSVVTRRSPGSPSGVGLFKKLG
jgi:hypothetical protein